ncbi:MAG: HAMP domain-containing histidine kinase [Cyclobacteriaceae bacterium]|nr:HAMP domain-containing histidine kinase [Cyclobacteriaceae bacterium]
MKIRNQIVYSFSTVVILLTIASSIIIYFAFSEYREAEFQQRIKDKINFTVRLLIRYKESSENLVSLIDSHTIHDFYDEKILIFDKHKNLIFKSLDDLQIHNYETLLNTLSPSIRTLEVKEGKYDVVAAYVERENEHFYAISKAYDAFGYSKLAFLRNILIGNIIFISLIVIFITIYLSNRISKPITSLAEQLSKLDLATDNLDNISVRSDSYELKYLTDKFNQLIKKTNDAFSYQKHIVHHISHQLKTPVAVLVSELERLVREVPENDLSSNLNQQVVKAKSLGEIINVLLEISRIESGKPVLKQKLRADELIYDVIASLNVIYPNFHFDVKYLPEEVSEKKLEILANPALIRQVFQNVLHNAVLYSSGNKAEIVFDCSYSGYLKVLLTNYGPAVLAEEVKYLFDYFFRGKNSVNKQGFGLGLVLTKRILELHSATINYRSPEPEENIFEIVFPLS